MHTTTLQRGGGELRPACCVLILSTHIQFKLEFNKSKFPPRLVFATVLRPQWQAFPLFTIIGYSILSQSGLNENYIGLNVLC